MTECSFGKLFTFEFRFLPKIWLIAEQILSMEGLLLTIILMYELNSCDMFEGVQWSKKDLRFYAFTYT